MIVVSIRFLTGFVIIYSGITTTHVINIIVVVGKTFTAVMVTPRYHQYRLHRSALPFILAFAAVRGRSLS